MKSFTLQNPFDYSPNFGGWSLLSNSERSAIKQRLFLLLADLADYVPALFDGFQITSAFRSLENNLFVGGVVDSKHLNGYAIDVALNAFSNEFYQVYCVLGSDKFEVIREKTHYHIQRSKNFISSDRSIVK